MRQSRISSHNTPVSVLENIYNICHPERSEGSHYHVKSFPVLNVSPEKVEILRSQESAPQDDNNDIINNTLIILIQ